MVAITATNYATPSTQAWTGRAQLQQARQAAEQAQARARQLRQQASQAEQEAEQGQARVGTLSAQLAQSSQFAPTSSTRQPAQSAPAAASDSTYTRQLQQERAAARARQTQEALVPVATAAANGFKPVSNPLPQAPRPWTKVGGPWAASGNPWAQQPASSSPVLTQSA